MLVMLANKHTRNACLLSDPSDHMARGAPDQDAVDPKKADRNNSGQLSLSPPLLKHHPMVTSLLNWSEVIIWPIKDGNGKRTFKLGPILTMSCHPWDSNAKNKTNQIPCNKTLPFLVCLASKLHGNQPQAGVVPNGRRTYSVNTPKPISHLFLARVHPPNHMRTFQLASLNLTCLRRKPWRNLLLSPNVSSPFLQPSPAHPAPPPIIIIDDMPIRSTLPPSTQPPPHSHNEACQELTDLRPTLMTPQAIVHESINQILSEHFQLLQMIPFVDAAHQNEMHREFREELSSLIGQALEAYPKEDITRIVSKYLDKYKKYILSTSYVL
ncbi:hypothetical protein O181_082726 [Austropuccinia psidii MF-1]|uniref:Uncharacterized protein n=1 Tax=Austropuccinia psidii MF-1 TaxID=1389203 RepID=A0A9Q3IH86_9BASI|nr:hypothetical protein [Austropuccinia psidii MF-1]